MAKEHELKSHISSVYDKINTVSVENFNLLREKLGSTTSVTPEYSLSSQITLLNKLKILDTKLPNTLETSVMELPLLEAEVIEEISGGVYGNGIYVAITDCNSDIVLVSTTGQKWKKIHTGLSGYRNQICYVNGYFVTASYDEMWYEYSKDGIRWTRKELTFIPSYICSTDNVLYFISVTEAASSYTIKVKYTTNIEEPPFTGFSYAVPTYISGDFNNNSNKCIALSNTQIVLLGNSSCISIVKKANEFTLQQIAVNMVYALPIILKSRHGITKGVLYRFASSDTLIYTKVNGDTVTYTDINVQDTNITKDTIAIMLDRDWDKTNDTGYMVINKTSVYTNTKLLSIVDNYASYPVDLTRSICVYGDVSFILLKKNFTKLNLVDYISKKSLVDETSDMYTMSLDDTIRNIPVMLENVSNGYDRSGYYRTTSGSFSVSSGAFIDITLPSKAEMILVYAKTSTAKTYLVKVINDEGQFQKYLYDTNQHVLKERRAEIIRKEISIGKYITEYSKETKIVNNTFHFVNSSEFTDFSYIAICSKIGNAYTVDEPALEPFELLSMKEVSYSNALCVHNGLVIGCSANGKDLILSSGSSNITKNIISSSENVKITSVYYAEDNNTNLYIGTDTNRIYIGTIDSNNMIDNLSLYTLDAAASIKFIKSIEYNKTILFAIGPDMTHIYYKTLSETSWTKYTDFTDSKTLKEVVVHGNILYLIPTSSKYIVTIRTNASGYVSSTINVTTEDITWGGCIVNNSRVCLIDNSASYLYYTDKGTSSAFKKVNIGSYGTTFVRGMYINGLYYIFLKDSKTCYAIYSSNLQYWEEIEMIDEAPYSNIRMSLDSAWYTNGYFVLVLSGGRLASLRYEIYGSRDDRPVMLCVNGVEIPNKTVHRLYGYGETANLTFYDYRTNSFIPLADITNLRIEGTGATLLNGVITFTAVGSAVIYYTYNGIDYTNIIAYRPYATDIQMTIPDRLYLNEVNSIPVQPLPSNNTYASLTGTINIGSADINSDDTNLIIIPKQTGELSGRIYMNLENGNRVSKEFSVTVYERVYPSDVVVTYPQSYIHSGTSMTPTITYVWDKSGDYIQQISDLEFSLTAPSDIIDKVHIDTNGKLTLDNFEFSTQSTIVAIIKTMNNLTKQISFVTSRTIVDISVENDLLMTSAYDYDSTGTNHVDILYTPDKITEPDLWIESNPLISSDNQGNVPYEITAGSFSNGVFGIDISTNHHAGDGSIDIYRGSKNPNPNIFLKKINIIYPNIRKSDIVNTTDNLFTSSTLYHICPLDETLLVLIIGTQYILEVNKNDYTIIRRIELPSKISPVLNKLFYLDGVFTLTSDGFTTGSTGTPATGHGQIWCSVDLVNWTNYGNLAPLFGAYTNVNRVKIVDKKLIFLCTGKILYCKIDWDTARTSFYPTCGSLSTTNTSMSTYEWIDCACGSRLVFLASGGQYIMVGGFSSTLSSTIVSGYTVATLNMAGNGRKWKCVGYLKQSFVFMATDGTMELCNHHLNYVHTSLVLAGMPAATDILDMWLINNNDALLLFIGAYTNTQYYYSSYYALWDGLSSTHAIAGKKLNLALSDGKIYSINQRENMYNEVSPVAVCQAYYSNTVPSKLLETGQTFTKCIYVDNMYIALSGKRIYVCNDSLISYYEYPDADITSFNDICPGNWVSDIVVYSNTSKKFIVLTLSLTTTIDIHTRVVDIGIDIVEMTDVFYNGHNLKCIVKLDTNVYRLLSTDNYVTFTNTNIGTAAYSRMRGVFVEQYAVIIGKSGASTWTLYSVGGSSLVLSTLVVMSNHIPTSNTCKAVYGNRRILFVFEKSMAYKETSSDAALNINLPYNINTILYETATFNCGIFAVLATNSMNEYYILLSKDCESWTRRKINSIDTYTSLMILPNNMIQIMNSNGKFYNYKISYTRYGSNTSNITETGYTFSTFGLNPSTTVRRIKSIDEYHFVMFNSPSANSLFYVSSNMEIKVLKLSGSETIVDVFVFQLKYLIATKTTCYVLTQDSSGNLTNPVEISASTFTNYQYIKDLIDNNQQIVDSISPYSPVNKNHDYLRNTFHAVCKQADGSLIYKTDKVVVSLPGNAAYAVKMIRESRGNNDLILTKDANGDYLTKIGSLGYKTYITFPAGEIMDFASINDSVVILSNQNRIFRFPTNLNWYMGSVYWLPENVVSKYPKLLVDDNRFILCAVDLVYESFDGITWKKDNIGTAAGDLYSNYVIIGGNVMQRWVFNTSNGNFKRYDIMKNR